MAKNQKAYDVTIRVAGDKVATIMALLAEEVTLLSMREVVGAPPVTKERSFTYAGGKKDKGISGERLLLQELRTGPMKREGLGKAFEAAGFKSTSADGATSHAIRNGFATRDDAGLVSITEAGRVHYDKGES